MTRSVAPEVLSLPVQGGSLALARWGDPAAPAVVASHGITANHLCWSWVAQALGDDVCLLAVDHRGRGASAALPGPYGIAAHVEDLVAVLDHAGAARGVLLGHSMGAFVIANAAAQHPERVASLVMVDGGLPLTSPLPEGSSPDAVLRAVIGPALERLDITFTSRDTYLERWRAHPAFVNDWDEAVEAYFLYDIEGADPHWRSKVRKEAVLEDGRAPFDRLQSSALQRTDRPAALLWAPRGVMDQAPGLYTADFVAEADARLEHLRTVHVPDVNHYTIVMSRRGASAVAAEVRDAVRRSSGACGAVTDSGLRARPRAIRCR